MKFRPFLQGKRVLIADDHEDLRTGCSINLEKAGLITETCANGAELQQILAERAADFDAVVTDLQEMGYDYNALRGLTLSLPALPFIIYSVDDTMAAYYLNPKESNVKAYVVKSDGSEALCDMLEKILSGKPGGYSKSVILRNRLTPRQLQTLKLLAKGMTRQIVAEQLDVSAACINVHCEEILFRLDAQNIAHAVHIATREGLI